MAQTYPYGTLVSDQAALIPESVARTMADLVPEATVFLSSMSPSLQNLDTPNGCANSPTYKYSERAFTPARCKLNGAINNSVTSVTFDKELAEVGMIAIIGTEAIKLTGTSDRLTFTCTRSYRTGAAAAHLDAATVLLVSDEYAQASGSLDASAVVEPNIITAYTRILKRGVGVSRTMKNVQKHGQQGGNWFEDSKVDAMVWLMNELEHELIFAKAVAPVSGSTGGNFDGFFERVGATSYTDMSSGDMDYDSLEDAVIGCADYTEDLGVTGGPEWLFVGRHQRGIIDRWNLPYVKNPLVEDRFGPVVRTIQVGGKLVNVATCSKLTTQAMLVSGAFIEMGPLTPDDEFTFYPNGRQSDAETGEIVGEYGGAVKEILAHHMFYGLLGA